jgi:hypothetical protein
MMAGVEGLFGPDGPHPFGAALRAFNRPDGSINATTTALQIAQPD